MEEMLRFFNLLHPLSAELQIHLFQVFVKESYRANRALIQEGNVCDWLGFIESGLVKIYLVENGLEKILYYRKAGEVVSSYSSFYTHSPSRFCIRAMEDTTIRKISRSALQSLYSRFPEFQVTSRLLSESYCTELESHCLQAFLPLSKAYRNLHETESWLLSDPRIKDYMLAAYLNVDKATFSRFKGRKY